MQTKTYQDLPADVQADLPREAVHFDESIPRGQVDIHSQGGVTRVSVNAFARLRRKARKAERQT